MEAEVYYQLAPGVVYTDIADESVIMSVDSSRYFSVKGAARVLLGALADRLETARMVELLCVRFAVSPEDAQRDLDAILPRLVSTGIVVMHG